MFGYGANTCIKMRAFES